MTDFILVHGAMHGGWCWEPVAQLLRESGNRVFTPTLTGQGELAHLLTPEVGVSTHVADIERVLDAESVTQGILVLHSYSGILAGPVLQNHAHQLRAVVYAGAFMAQSGESLLDVEPAPVAAKYQELISDYGDGWRVPVQDSFLDQWGIVDSQLREFVGSRLTDFPARCVNDKVIFENSGMAGVALYYLEHTHPPLQSLELSRERARERGAVMLKIASGHDFMLSDPEGTSAILGSIATGKLC